MNITCIFFQYDVTSHCYNIPWIFDFRQGHHISAKVPSSTKICWYFYRCRDIWRWLRLKQKNKTNQTFFLNHQLKIFLSWNCPAFVDFFSLKIWLFPIFLMSMIAWQLADWHAFGWSEKYIKSAYAGAHLCSIVYSPPQISLS